MKTNTYRPKERTGPGRIFIFLMAIVLLSLLVLSSGCIDNGIDEEITDEDEVSDIELIAADGTVIFVDLEGGFYGILTDLGQQFYPLNLDEMYSQDGMEVTFVAQVKDDIVTAQMWGIPVEIMAVAEQGEAEFVYGHGTITYVDLEGGFYGIVGDDGEQYLPLELDSRYEADGMRILFVGELKTDVMTIYQWGTPVEIHEIPWAAHDY